MRKYIVVVLCLSVLCLTAQDKIQRKNQLEFSTGYNFGALKNLEIAPVSRYDYSGLTYKLDYQLTSKKENLFIVQLDYLESQLKTDAIPVLNLDYAKMGLRFSYLKQIYNENKFSIHLGLESYSNISTYSKNNRHIGNEATNIINQSLGAASQFTYQVNEKHNLSSRLAMPFVLLRATHARSGIYSLKRYQGMSWNIGYNYSVSNRFDATFSYDFNYDRLQITSAFREVQHRLNFGLKFKF